jgi:hypothetical protein
MQKYCIGMRKDSALKNMYLERNLQVCICHGWYSIPAQEEGNQSTVEAGAISGRRYKLSPSRLAYGN